MKIKVFSIFALVFLAISCKKGENQRDNNGKILPDIINSGDKSIKTKDFVGNFDEIEVSQAIEAEIIKSDQEKVIISAPASLLDDVIVKIENGKLDIGYKSGIRIINTNNVKATIYAKDFTKLEANGAASITVKDKFTQEKVEVDVSGAADIQGDLEANDFEIKSDGAGKYKGKIWAIDLKIEASSSGEVSISGKAKNTEIDASSAADVAASGVITETAKIDASSSAEVSLGVISSLEAEASSAGDIKITKKGDLKVLKKEESSGGSINLQ